MNEKAPKEIWDAYSQVNAAIPNCRRQMSLFWWDETGRFFVAKHCDHKIPSRFDGAVHCGTFYLLYDRKNMDGAAIGSGYLYMFRGRWSNRRNMPVINKIMERRKQ